MADDSAALARVDERLTQIERKIDRIIDDHENRLRDVETRTGNQAARLSEVETDTRDHEKRLRSVERWMYALPPTLLLSAVSIVLALSK